MNKSGFLRKQRSKDLKIKKLNNPDAYKGSFLVINFVACKELKFKFYFPTSISEVKGNYIQFPEHVLWPYQLKSQ